MNIGISTNNLIYEGTSAWGCALWPPPFLFPCNFQPVQDVELRPAQESAVLDSKYIFREDSFDPVSRVRRGRFYRKSLQQPTEWYVYPHPALPIENRQARTDGSIAKELTTFESFRLMSELPDLITVQRLIILGTTSRFSLWTIHNLEGIAGGEEMVVLRSRQTFGALPRILMENIPQLRRVKVMEMLNKLSEEVYKSGPESVTDRCRDAASAILGSYLEERGIAKFEDDLGKLIRKFSDSAEPKKLVINCAETIRQLHPRVKPAEQEKWKSRPIVEQDAELAVQCLGTILCELEWGKWF